MKIKLIALVLSTLCLTSCSGAGVKKTSTLKMSAEAKAFCDYYHENPEDKYFKPGELFNKTMAKLFSRSDVPQEVPKDLKFENTPTRSVVDRQNVYTFAQTNYDKIIMNIHGGAYVFEAVSAHWTYSDGLCSALNAKVVMPLYPLAPQHLFNEAYKMILAVYKGLLKENKPVYIIGDSAGGGFTLALTEYCLANNIQAPKKIVMFSPFLDVTLSNEEIKNYEEKDVMVSAYGAKICGQLWAGDFDNKDYRVSPIYGNLNNLPDMLVYVSDSEIVYPDIIKLYNKVKNTNIHLVIGEGFFHVFPIYPIPERQTSYQMISEFFK